MFELCRHPAPHALHADSCSAEHVERFFRDLTENRLRRGPSAGRGVIAAIFDYIDHHNDNPKPFI